MAEAHWLLNLPASLTDLQRLMAEYGVSAQTAQLLHARGLSRAALQTELRLTPNERLLEAARQIMRAIRQRKRIRIHGDYDADGVSATATLVLGLRELGADVHGFIPHRLNEGYGVHPSRVDEHASAADLLVTVDCGVSNHAEVQSLLDKGLEVIVTDHHAPGEQYPATLVVHPHLTEGYDPDIHNLTGAGVAYHLLWAVRQEWGLTQPEPRHLSPLATLGTVADVAPLTGENRALVRAGLAEFPTTALPGLRALMGEKKTVNVRDVSYSLAPRVNAAGRMGEADAALQLLTTASPQEASTLATFLNIKNEKRRALQDQMLAEALELADPADPALVITAPHWHPGIMGIVAAKLLERHYKPVYIVAQGKGSVRSTPGISAVGGLRYAAELLSRYGGHTGAAGFAMPEENFDALRLKIHSYVRQFPEPKPTLQLDGALSTAHISLGLQEELAQFEPYGEGWREPLWHLRAPPEKARMVGKQKPPSTLSFVVRGVRAIQFGQKQVPIGEQDLAAAVSRSEYLGDVRAELRLEDKRPATALSAPGQDVPAIERLHVRQVRAYAAQHPEVPVYALPEAQAWWRQHFPQARLLSEQDEVSGTLLLCALPPADTLARWAGQAHLVLAWGPPTLQALRSGEGQADAESYWRWQWGQLYEILDDEGFARAAAALLGLPQKGTPDAMA